MDKKTRSELNAPEFARQLAVLAKLTAAAEAEPPEVQRKRVERANRFAAKKQRREAQRLTLAKYQAQLERKAERMHIAAMQQVTRENLSAARSPQRVACERESRAGTARSVALAPARLGD